MNGTKKVDENRGGNMEEATSTNNNKSNKQQKTEKTKTTNKQNKNKKNTTTKNLGIKAEETNLDKNQHSIKKYLTKTKTTELEEYKIKINIAQPKLVAPSTKTTLQTTRITASEYATPATRAVPQTPPPTRGLKVKGVKVENLKLFLENKRRERATSAASMKDTIGGGNQNIPSENQTKPCLEIKRSLSRITGLAKPNLENIS